jgi:lipopolysaccharide transport system ATP-binding protein
VDLTGMDMDVSIRLERVCLDVPIFLQRERDSRNWLSVLLGAAFDPPRREMRTLLDDLSFEARDGDRIALLGLNGAGKSTLLRVLNGAYLPSRGSIRVSGSRQALLNISLGFNGEATVRENIFLRGNAMGMKTALIRELIEPILEFAGLQEKSSHRLRTLSSGQRMRLGFAISTAVQHDIMLMDEWVGTGDAEFMAKATERMQSRVAGSKIVVLASHSVGLLRGVCNRGLVMDGGRIVFDGDIDQALKAYHEVVLRAQAAGGGPEERLATTGVLESVMLEDGVLTLRGWALQGFVAMPTVLAFEFAGERHLITEFQRISRPDVQRHFGLHDPVCGFQASLRVPGLASLAELGTSPVVLGGSQSDRLDGPLRLASTARAALLRLLARDSSK